MGKMPDPTSPSSSEPKPSTRSCNSQSRSERAKQIRQHLPGFPQMTFGERRCVRRLVRSDVDSFRTTANVRHKARGWFDHPRRAHSHEDRAFAQCVEDAIQLERHLAEPADVGANPSAAIASGRSIAKRLPSIVTLAGRAWRRCHASTFGAAQRRAPPSAVRSPPVNWAIRCRDAGNPRPTRDDRHQRTAPATSRRDLPERLRRSGA